MFKVISKFKFQAHSFWHCDRGATLVEYGLLVAVVAMVVVVGALALGGSIGDAFCDMAVDLDANAVC